MQVENALQFLHDNNTSTVIDGHVGQNYRLTHRISNMSMYTRGGTRKDAHRSPYMGTQTCGIKSKGDCGSTRMDDLGSVCMDVSTESIAFHRSTCSYITTKGMDLHGVTYTDDSTTKYGRTWYNERV